ncbi:quercetin 2,3-dioxygenase [Geomonas sp. Red276]
MVRIRKASQRGHADHGWLNTYHTFSFADYYDPAHMGFRALRVINEDRVQPAMGFPTHPHRDMEIISYVLEGALEHRDSMDNGSTIRPGEVQQMTAGTGITHSEFNHSASEGLHFLQIWILPAHNGLTPGYQQKYFAPDEKRGCLRLIASPDGREGSVTIHQDAHLFASLLEKGERVSHSLRPGRHAWLQVVRGEVTLNGQQLAAGDGAAISDEPTVALEGLTSAELLLFDLA